MSDTVFLELSKYGLGVLVLIGGIRWLAARYEILMAKNEATVQLMMTRCDQERLTLNSRIKLIEDRQFQSFNEILSAAVAALEVNARAFDKLSDIESDQFRAITPKEHT